MFPVADVHNKSFYACPPVQFSSFKFSAKFGPSGKSGLSRKNLGEGKSRIIAENVCPLLLEMYTYHLSHFCKDRQTDRWTELLLAME